MPTPRAIKVLVPIVVLLLMVGSAAVVAVTVTRGGGPVTNVKTATETEYVSTQGFSFTDVPGMRTTVNVPAGQSALLIVTFSGVSTCSQSPLVTAFCYVRVVVDDIPATPVGVQFDSAIDGNSREWAPEANSMQYVAGPLAAGRHVVKVQYQVDEPNTTFELRSRTLTVLRSRL